MSGASGSATLGGSMQGASGSASELDPYFQPGSRLKPIVLTTDDGGEILDAALDRGWHDSELDFDCYFLPDEAGVERCFPRALTNGAFYSDAACTRPVLTTGTSPCQDSPYVVSPPTSCGHRGFKVGDELPASTPLFTSQGNGCQPTPGTPDLGPLRDLEPVPAETFVGMERTSRARAPGLDAHVREGTDGSWQVIGYFDPARAASCSESSVDLAQASRCVPRVANLGKLFAGPTCEQRAVNAPDRSCDIEQPTAMGNVEQDPGSCPPTYQLEAYEIDEVRETSTYQLDDSEACAESGLPPAKHYIQGEPLDVSSLPVLETLVIGTGRVRMAFSGFAGVPFLPRLRGPSLLDESDGPCMLFEFPDGTLRCVPTAIAVGVASGVVFEDAACSGPPITVWYGGGCLAAPPLPKRIVTPDPAAKCGGPRLAEVIAVQGKSTATAFFAENAATGACEPAAPLGQTALPLRLGDAESSSVFPEVRRTIRQ